MLAWIKVNVTPILVVIGIVVSIYLYWLQRKRFITEHKKMRNHLTSVTLYDKHIDLIIKGTKNGTFTLEQAFKQIDKLGEGLAKSTEGEE